LRNIKELISLAGRVALITGGAGHIGSAMAEALAEMGAHIAIVDISDKVSSGICERIRREYKVRSLPVVADLSLEERIRTIPGEVVAEYGRLDILINCAALGGADPLPGWTTPFEEQSVDTWRRALDINLTASFLLTQACSPALKKSGRGSIINVASIYGIQGPDMRLYEGTPMGNPAAYGASKGGLLQLTRWLATVLAPHIRVNAISPGGVWRNQPEQFCDRYTDKTPLGRMATEEDLKGIAVYLASDLSAYVTGQNIIVDGGFSVW